MTLDEFGILIGILTAFATGGYFIYKKFKEKLKMIREKFDGSWGNEGDVSMINYETHVIELNLEVDKEDGVLSGVLRSRVIGNEEYTPELSVNGRIRLKTASIRFSHIKNGNLIVYGKAKLTLKDKHLIWKLLDGDEYQFPKKTSLFKQISIIS